MTTQTLISGQTETSGRLRPNARCLFCRWAQPPAMSRRNSVLCGLSRESAAGHWAGSQEECRWLFTLFSTGGQATVMPSWISWFSADSQARVPPVVLR
jgi:hypothetical protein